MLVTLAGIVTFPQFAASGDGEGKAIGICSVAKLGLRRYHRSEWQQNHKPVDGTLHLFTQNAENMTRNNLRVIELKIYRQPQWPLARKGNTGATKSCRSDFAWFNPAPRTPWDIGSTAATQTTKGAYGATKAR